jgi:SAM-dependent methyltransferase
MSPDSGKFSPERRKLLDMARGKDCLVLGPLGVYEGYRESAEPWDFAYLSRVCSSVLGLDICAPLVDLARRDGFNVQVGDAERFDLPESFDIVYSADLIEHLGRPLDFLICAARSLRRDGCIIVETPNPLGINVLLKGLVTGRFRSFYEHTCWIDSGNALELGRRAGLSLEAWNYTPVVKERGLGQWLRTSVYNWIGMVRPGLHTKCLHIPDAGPGYAAKNTLRLRELTIRLGDPALEWLVKCAGMASHASLRSPFWPLLYSSPRFPPRGRATSLVTAPGGRI